ncbi:hypothetical protein C8J56DRAFT_1039884 [Mycena floridula]|nr:hypothetical protein C8J56DRAFT_1039884 [Mycena floridula]
MGFGPIISDPPHNVWVNEEAVKEVHRKSGLDEDDEEEDAAAAQGTDDPFETKAIAHQRHLLEKKWGNKHDRSYAYKDPVTSKETPLTPIMMATWSRSMFEGESTILQPPNIPLFDPAHREERIDPFQHRQRQESSASSSGSTSDIHAVSTMVTAITQLVSRSSPLPASSTL